MFTWLIRHYSAVYYVLFGILLILLLLEAILGIYNLNALAAPIIGLSCLLVFVIHIAFLSCNSLVKRYGTTAVSRWLFILPFWALPGISGAVIFSAFIFLAPDPYHGIVLINGKTSLSQRFFWVTPFQEHIQWVQGHYTVRQYVIGTTADGAQIRSWLEADMKLVANESTLLRLASLFDDVNQKIQEDLEQHLQASYEVAISKNPLADLTHLTIEHMTGEHTNTEKLTELGVTWAGTIEISDTHRYMARDI